ncbi:MAG: prepilin-type N-terminal cleavage/methylation domain-containing protein [Oscillospiraceae bacterium]|nr:prepilin-type N-terminal cleavage/methylation domain-containing protein [Oscillospiraceae bacterium]
MKKMLSKKRKGFSLVELIIVIAIIAILSVVAVIAYANLQADAKDAILMSEASFMSRTLNTFNSLTGTPLTAKPSYADVTGTALKLSTTKTPTADLINLDLTIDPSTNSEEAYAWVTFAGGKFGASKPATP